MTSSLTAFIVVAAIITITPGVDTALIVRTTLRHGRRGGLVAALGVGTGLLAWGLATALGITLLLRASQTAYDVLRVAGAVWLVALGLRTVLTARRSASTDAVVADRADDAPRATSATRTTVRGPRGDLSAYRAGMLSNLLNPKIGVFYLTLLPQFVPAGVPVLPMTMLLAAIHALQALLWLAAVAWLVSRARELMGRGAVRRAMERITGTVLIGLGLRLALERR